MRQAAWPKGQRTLLPLSTHAATLSCAQELQWGFVPKNVVTDLYDIGNWKVGEQHAALCLAREPCSSE